MVPGTPPLITLDWKFGNLSSIRGAHKVNCPFARHSLDLPLFRQDGYSSTGDEGAIVTAYHIEVEKSLVVDVYDDQTQFVDVTRHHERRRAVQTQRGMTTTKRINLKGIGFRLNVLGDYGSSLILETGWRTSFK